MKNWTWIKNEGFKRHKSEKQAIRYLKLCKPGQENIKSIDTGIDPDCAIYSDSEIAELLNKK